MIVLPRLHYPLKTTTNKQTKKQESTERSHTFCLTLFRKWIKWSKMFGDGLYIAYYTSKSGIWLVIS